MEHREYLTVNLHTHTTRCGHASGVDEDYVKAAIAAGIRVLGFSDHIPWPVRFPRMKQMHMAMEDIADYVTSIRSLQEKYRDQIRILIGFEAEYLPEFYEEQMAAFREWKMDYMILGQHFLPGKVIRKYTGTKTRDEQVLARYVDVVLEGLETGSYVYLCHPDLLRFEGDAMVYRKHMLRLCQVAKELGIPLEINLLGAGEGRHYPGERFFAIASQMGNEIVLGIDAHDPKRIGDREAYGKGMRLAKKYGLHLLDQEELAARCQKNS